MFSQTKPEKVVQKLNHDDLMVIIAELKKSLDENFKVVIESQLASVVDRKLRDMLADGLGNVADRVILMLIKRALESENK